MAAGGCARLARHIGVRPRVSRARVRPTQLGPAIPYGMAGPFLRLRFYRVLMGIRNW